MKHWLSISYPKHIPKQLSWTSYSHVQGTLHCHTRRRCSWFPKKFVGPLTPLDRIKTQTSPASNPRPFQISMVVLPRPFQLLRHTARTPMLLYHCPQEDWDKKLVGLPWCIWLECWCSTTTLTVPHHCRQSHQSCPSIRQSGIKAPQTYTDKRHTNGPHCPWRDCCYRWNYFHVELR